MLLLLLHGLVHLGRAVVLLLLCRRCDIQLTATAHVATVLAAADTATASADDASFIGHIERIAAQTYVLLLLLLLIGQVEAVGRAVYGRRSADHMHEIAVG